MASAAVNTHDQHYKVILLGKTGSGKSASGNTILGQKSFNSRKTFKSVTQDVQKETATFPEVTLDVYDTPGLFNTAKSNEDILVKWKSELNLDESACTVILMVMKVDRFTLEDKEAVRLMENFIPEDLIQNTWILFTRGDELMRAELTIEEFLEDTEQLQELVLRFQNRYHVFDNISQNPDQVQKLINKIRKSSRIISLEISEPADLPHRRLVLLGKTGVGKSATGNTILRETRFKSELSSSSITSKCEIQSEIVLGRNISVIDTPGLFDTKLSQEELSVEIGKCIYLSSPGPHAFLYVLPVNMKFTEQEEDVVQKLEKIFGGEMKKYTIVLFTYGDLIEGKSVDELIKENRSLRRTFDECGGRYQLVNNKQQNREQVSELLQKIDAMVEENGGTYYSNEMYKEAERSRREGGFTEFYRRNKRKLLTAAGFGSGAAFGATIGAIVGGAVGGPVGAGIGASFIAVLGAGVGFGVGTAYCKKTESHNDIIENTDRVSAPDIDGGHESHDSESMSYDENTLLLGDKKSQ